MAKQLQDHKMLCQSWIETLNVSVLYLVIKDPWFCVQNGVCRQTGSAHNGEPDNQSILHWDTVVCHDDVVVTGLRTYFLSSSETRTPCTDRLLERDYKPAIHKPSSIKKGKMLFHVLTFARSWGSCLNLNARFQSDQTSSKGPSKW